MPESAKLKTVSLPKKLPKNDREMAVLFGLIDLYIKSGKPIGSQTLLENGFESLSSATIRNYFSKLETLGFLKQPHTSGGRIPTAKAFRCYADHFRDKGVLNDTQGESLHRGFQKKEKEIATLIHQATEGLSRLSKCAAFISMPRFDQDFIQDIRLLSLDTTRLLAVIISDFGLIRTEALFVEQALDESFLKECERYFLWRLGKGDAVSFDQESHLKLAQRIYNEVMVRHVVGYLNFPTEDVLRCGVSRLLAYPEFSDASAVVNSLALLEDKEQMRRLLRECSRNQSLTYWIGEDLSPSGLTGTENTAIAIPYRINQSIAGAVALLGPLRLPYPELFGLLRHFSDLLSEVLTESVYKFKLTFRQPTGSDAESMICNSELVKKNQSILLEDQSRNS